MEGKLLRCTFCGAKIPYVDTETVVCPHCDSVNYFRFASKLGEKNDAAQVNNLRARLHACVNEKYHDFAEMKEIADEILNLAGYDFEAKYFYALALKKNNKRGKYNEFLLSKLNLAPNPQSLELVLGNVIRYARQNERTAIHTFIEANVSDALAREEYKDRADRQIERSIRDYHGGQDVFICHKAEDGAAAWSVVDRLESEGITCFISERNLEDLEVGEKFESALKEAISSCRMFLFISSPRAFRRDEDNYAMLEVAEAGRLNKPLAEFRIEAVDRTAEKGSPEYKTFRGCQYIEAYPHYFDLLDKLSEQLKEKLSRMSDGSELERLKRQLEADSRVKEDEIRRLKDEQEQTKKRLERIEFEKEEALKKLYELEQQSSATKSEAVADGGNPTAERLYREAVELDFKAEATEENKRRAVALYRQAAELGYAPAMFNLGVSCEEGDGVEADVAEANRWYILAAEAGHAAAMFNLGNNYRIGRGLARNTARAFDLFRRAADAGNTDALINLGVAYERGEGTSPDPQHAVECYKRAALNGSSAAAYNLALCYRSGVGTQKSEELFRYWLEKAAEGGASEAAGLLVETDKSGGDAETIYKRACEYDYGKNGTVDKTAAARLYRQAADLGYAPAQLNLGVAYEYGEGVPRDLSQAFKWYAAAAEAGNAMAQCNLGYCYYTGSGVARDLSKAIVWYRRAADNGNARAYNNLGYCYEHGEGVPKNLKRAFDCYKTAAQKGDTYGAGNAAWCYESGLGVAVDLVKAREWYAIGREKGIERAARGFERVDGKLMLCSAAAGELYKKGCKLDFGDGVKQNKGKAVELYARAAKAGCVPAQYNLGICYLEGKTPDYPKALDCFMRAAEKGHVKASLWAGQLFERGQGTPVNLKTAAAYYAQAARAGDGEAQRRIAGLYERGMGVAYDLNKAFSWYRRSAGNNCAQGLVGLGNCYAEGKGTVKDGQLAFDSYKRAADLGDATAMLNLGCCYHNGIGVQPDREEEIAWYSKAVDAGCAAACYNLGYAYEEEGDASRDLARRAYEKGARLGDESCKRKLELYQ